MIWRDTLVLFHHTSKRILWRGACSWYTFIRDTIVDNFMDLCTHMRPYNLMTIYIFENLSFYSAYATFAATRTTRRMYIFWETILWILFLIYSIRMKFVVLFVFIIFIMSSSTRTRKLNEKGLDLLERNMRGKCASAFRAANTVGNKLVPLLDTSDTHPDVDLVKRYYEQLEGSICDVIAAHENYCAKLAGNLDILADFNGWFETRFSTLCQVRDHVRDWLSQHKHKVELVSDNVSVDDLDIAPEDSVSQTKSVKMSCVSSKSHSNQSKVSSSSIKSARLKELLKKVTLLAEASNLVKKQELLRKELEISLEKESLELTTKIASASAKEELLADFVSDVSVSGCSRNKFMSNAESFVGQANGLADSDCLFGNVKVKKDEPVAQLEPCPTGLKQLETNETFTTVDQFVCSVDVDPGLVSRAAVHTYAGSSRVSPSAAPLSITPDFSQKVSTGMVGKSDALQTTAASTSHVSVTQIHSTLTTPKSVCSASHAGLTSGGSLHPVTFSHSQLDPTSAAFVPKDLLQRPTSVNPMVSMQDYGAGKFCVNETAGSFHHRSTPLPNLSDYEAYGAHAFDSQSRHAGFNVVDKPAFVHSVSHMPGESQFGAVLNKLTDVLMDQRNRLPEVSIAKFSGNPLEYNLFMRNLDSRIVSRTNDMRERLYFLEQYTTGTPREIVRSCMLLPELTGYEEARRCLDERYGDKYLIAQSYVKQLESWQTIRSDDVKKLDDFTTFLVGCRNAMTSTDSIRELDYPTSLRLIVSKLPVYLQERWAREADNIMRQEGGSVTFGRLVAFIQREYRIKMNPLFGKAVHPDRSKSQLDKKKGKSQSSKQATSFAAAVTTPKTFVSPTAFQAPCLFCEFQHPFNACRKFRKSLHKDKMAFLMKHKMCFDCLSVGHVRSECPKKASCEVCGGFHPTVLHRPTTKSGSEGASGDSGDSNSVSVSASESVAHSVSVTTAAAVTSAAIATARPDSSTMPIVPVKVRLMSSDREVFTYAFHDSGSSDTLITKNLMKELRVCGKKSTICLTTLNTDSVLTPCFAVSNLEVCGVNKTSYVPLPTVYTQGSLPVSTEQIPRQEDVDRWPYLSHISLPFVEAGVGILIGGNVPKAMEPWDVVHSVDDGPYAVETVLGWCINGPLRQVSEVDDSAHLVTVNRIEVLSSLDQQLQRFFNQDFSERHVFTDDKALSVEDSQFLEMVERQTSLKDGHYEICLPLRNDSVPLPNNRSLAVQRLKGLEKRFTASDTFKRKYTEFVEDLFVRGYSSQVPEEELLRSDGMVWYFPHHGVIHPRKDKLRVVLDASARFAGTSLNNCLLSGPDLSSSLVGVLNRFRQERVAFMSDLECMFYQVKVPNDQRDLLRFLWWTNGDVERGVVECRMHAHIFGATSSPAVAKYALRQTALDNAESFSSQVVETFMRSFYVDDCLKSVPSVLEAISLSSELRDLAQKGGFRLTQWVSNNREVLCTIPESERAKNVKTVDLTHDELPSEKALGVLWSVASDTLGFHISVSDKPLTRRGILSIVSSVYDPLGMVAPFVLMGKKIIQDLCRMKLGWDERIPDDISIRWQQWLDSLWCLDQFSIPRCFQPEGFGCLTSVVLHHFADASDLGYGCVSYIRFLDDVGQVHCSFVMGRSRVAPLKQITIPRMELTAAVLAVRIDAQLRKELDMSLGESSFWSDSTSVLGYAKNDKARFNMFVANRVVVIRENSSPFQWRYVPTHLNPADDASRGLDGEALLQCRRWKNGPKFLWECEEEWPVQPNSHTVDDKDPEVKQVKTACISRKDKTNHILVRILAYFSDWFRLKRFVALLRRAVLGWKHVSSGDIGPDPRTTSLCSIDLARAELIILRWSQEMSYSKEIKHLKTHTAGGGLKGGKLASLDPYLVDGVLQVGGRIQNAPVSDDLKHPILVPQDSPVAELIIRDIHKQVGHGGREQVLSRLWENYWIVRGNSLTREVLKACRICRQRFGSPLSQKMANLPGDRVSPDLPPFTNVGVDYFGPISVKQGRSLVKRYGALFTCLVSRAAHIEMSVSLETDAFINTLRRFIARRGQVKVMRSDNGTNLVGAERELRQALQGWNQSLIESTLLQKNIDWIFNAPGASHHGGSWERIIRSTRRVLLGLLKEQTLTDDGLTTLLAEVEAIPNGRPLTRTSSDPSD